MAGRQSVGTMLVQITADSAGVEAGVKRAQKSLNSFASGLTGIAARVDASLTAAFKRAGAAAVATATAAGLVGASFQAQMSKVQAVAGATQEDLAALTEEARRIGKDTKFSATEAAYGMEALAQAGFNAGQIISATGSAMALAGANGIDLDTATGLVASTLHQFSLAADDAGRVADVFTRASQRSLLTVNDLTIAMRYAGTAGAAVGYSLEETTAALAQFRNLGLTGQQAGTNFRAMMESLANPTQTAEGALKSLGLTMEDVNPTMHSFDEIVQTLSDHGLDLATSYKIFGSIAGGNVVSIVNGWEKAKKSGEGYLGLLSDLEASQGTAERTFAAMADNVSGRWAQLKSATEEFFLVLFDALRGPLQRLMEGLSERVNLLSEAFGAGTAEASDRLDRIVDGLLAVVDAAILLIPRLQEIGVIMFAALVASKGVTWAAALSQLAGSFGVDLPAAIGKAITALRAMGAAQAAFTVTGLAAVLAGLAALVVGLLKVADSYTGAARAARELAGVQKGLQQFDAAQEARRAKVGETLQRMKDEIVKRQELGEAITGQERALLEYTDAQAFEEVKAGKLLVYYDKLVRVSEASREEIDAFRESLGEQAHDAGALADRLDFLVSQYQESGAIEWLNDAVMRYGGVLRQATEETGREIRTLEDLKAAATAARKTQEGLTAQEKAYATQAAIARSATKEKSDATDTDTGSTKDNTDAKKEATKAEEVHIIAIRKTVKSYEELAAIGAGMVQTAPTVVDSLAGVSENAAAAAATLLELEDVPGFFERMADGVRNLASTLKSDLIDFVKGELPKIGKAAGEVGIKLARGAAGLISSIISPIYEMIRPLFNLQSTFSGAFGQENKTNKPDEMLARIRAKRAVQEQTQGVISFVRTFAAALPKIVNAIIDHIPGIVDAIVDSIPKTTKALVDAVPKLIGAILAELPRVIEALGTGTAMIIRSIPELLTQVLTNLPEIVISLSRQVPKIIEAVIDATPEIIVALIASTPELIFAIIEAVPRIVFAFITFLPKLLGAVIAGIPEFFSAFFASWKGMGDKFKEWASWFAGQIGNAFLEVVTFGLYKGKDKGPGGADSSDGKGIIGKIGQAIGSLFGGRNADGLSYAPRTMATVIEPGERIMTALENQAYSRRRLNEPAPLAAGGGGGDTRIGVYLGDRIVEDVLVSGVESGRTPKTRRLLRTTSGRRPGFNRGPFQPFSRG